uniref:Uncharacterized protein n=1 Tax=Oryzias sinensis TaxID=183150 RepID=A0A8C7ZZ36_9TELE
MHSLLTGVKGSFQGLDVSCNARNSVDAHFVHPPPFDLLHTLPNDERDFGLPFFISGNIFMSLTYLGKT